jgi:hypothetical protein
LSPAKSRHNPSILGALIHANVIDAISTSLGGVTDGSTNGSGKATTLQ